MTEKLSREDLIKDARQLSDILEDTHPDPYINGGGKIAYHRRLQELIISIPNEGMTKDEFFFHINPFLAKLEDAHTGLEFEQQLQNKDFPGGIPLYFIPIEDFLFVGAVVHEEDHSLLGAKLLTIENISLEKLIKRMKNLQGFDNLNNLLGALGRYGVLFYQHTLQRLLPEWNTNENKIEVSLAFPNGEIVKKQLETKRKVEYPLYYGQSKISLLNTQKGIDYHFIDDEKNIAYLKINDMITYREAHELFQNIGLTDFHDLIKEFYKKYNDTEVPEELSDIIQGLPSVTELFTSLFCEMKNSQTNYLIVDVSKCRGGQDYIVLFLLYYLIDFQKSVENIQSRSDVLKFSKIISESSKNGLNLESIPYFKQMPLIESDYYFGNDKSFSLYQENSQQIENYSNSMKHMPSFYKEFKSREHEAYYIPQKILVLSSDIT
ncbi:MAG: hypothetical protein ACFFDW_14320, partial [Candidatus Thorarchaeota archaeon]